MRRIRVVPATLGNSGAENLRLQYQAFKKENPGNHARVPCEIKLLARSLIDSGSTVNALAKEIGLGPTSIRSWLKTLDLEAPKPRRNSAPSMTGAQQKRSNKSEPHRSYEIKQEIIRLTSRGVKTNGESQRRLGELARTMIDQGSSIENIASMTGSHPLTVVSKHDNPRAHFHIRPGSADSMNSE